MGTLHGMELKKPPPAPVPTADDDSSWTGWLFQVARGAVALTRNILVQTLQLSWMFCQHAWSSLVQPLLLLPWSSSSGSSSSSSTDSSGDGAAADPRRRRHHRND
jgi:hypothetical protein